MGVPISGTACYSEDMSEAARKVPAVMDTAEFLAWDAPAKERWQLIDGHPQAMAPASETHNIIQGELGALIRNHLVAMGRRCTLVPNAGIVPHVRSDRNVRIPDLAVTCVRSAQESQSTSDPVLLVEILSPSNQAETWINVWAYTAIPSVQEILVLHSTAIRAEMLRRDANGNWPERPELMEDGMLELHSIGLQLPLAAAYGGTRFDRTLPA
jgi:Uma2 family endonuclease